MYIDISDKAKAYLQKKVAFFLSRSRVPRIVLAERSCTGANFRLFFEPASENDEKISLSDLDIYVPKELLNEFTGFNLDLETFFFASRLKIQPKIQSYKCNCDGNCGHAAKS